MVIWIMEFIHCSYYSDKILKCVQYVYYLVLFGNCLFDDLHIL